MDERRKAAWEELNITKEELKTIGDALKQKEFRKLLGDYVNEINDPENKRIYEEEIKQLEKERGVDCSFVHPTPGYVLKTSVDGKSKAFINICHNDQIDKPTSSPGSSAAGTRGLNWSLPFIQAPPKDDLDKNNKLCTVFDVVFHPDTLRLAANNAQFRTMVNNTALDAVENSFKIQLDRKNLKFPKMTYKGSPQPTVIRKKSKVTPTTSESNSDLDFPLPYPYPYKELNGDEPVKQIHNVAIDSKKQDQDDYTVPHYTIKYRDSVDIQDFANDRNAKINAAIPKELIVTIFLPLLSSSTYVELDVNEKWVHLKSTQVAKYFLHLPLPYAISEELGNAKFDKAERKLVLTLPVKRTSKTVSDLTREDSGVESDAGVHTPELEEEVLEDNVSNLITVVSSSNLDNSERTNVCDVQESILNPDIQYSLPPFTCNIVENILAFTLHVKNVDPDSLKHKHFDNGLHMVFSSIGSGFFPIYYAFYVKLPALFTIAKDGISVEAWDNNVITQLVLNTCDTMLTSYLVGTDEENTTPQELLEPAVIGLKQEIPECDEANSEVHIQIIEKSKDIAIIEITPREKNEINEENHCKIEEEDNEAAEDEDDVLEDEDDVITEEDTDATSQEHRENTAIHQPRPVPKKHLKLDSEKARSYSESSSDELNLSPTKRGILKCRTVNRSLSESNAEDYCLSSSLDVFQRSVSSDSCIPEEPEESLGSKKTVRFNEVILKKTFRINSSILGQKKKNQRKLRNRKRAQERRASESENSEGEPEKGKENNKGKKKTSDDGEEASSASDEALHAGAELKRSDLEMATVGKGEKLVHSSGSADDATDVADERAEEVRLHLPNSPEGAEGQSKDAPVATTKHANRRKKNKRTRNSKNYGMQQLDFKNELIFDLDM